MEGSQQFALGTTRCLVLSGESDIQTPQDRFALFTEGVGPNYKPLAGRDLEGSPQGDPWGDP